ncbi:hypothetical protein TNCV_2181941 [Trichonephila clavipes]|uniref:Uncharacterized protein n=1 Tax=Trichonephila clavipes TaxID=2585209 RepID=A0A8X6VUX3_TRICX|nr:hypothetical protein TNCV_2181941 [Trichonephila clavipes]
MDLSPPHSRPTTPNSDVMTEETSCQRLVRTTANIKRFTTTRDGYKQILTSLESDANHDPTNALYVKIQKEYEEISALLENGVSDFGSLPLLPSSQQATAQQNAQAGGTTSSSTAANRNTTQTEVTPSSQKPGITNTSTQGVQPRVTPSSTQNNTPRVPLPQPVMLFITKHYREPLKTLTMIFPNLRTKITGEFLKLYTNNHEEYHSLKETIKQLHYQFYVITAKNDRPIKVVIKGLPKSTHVDEIKLDLEEQGF